LKKEGKNMKKVLLASTILAVSAGFAAAEVTLSGSARMGLVYNSTLGDDANGETVFSSRVRIVFTASGETDGGLTFGASMRADQQAGNNNDAGGDKDGDSNGDSTVFISGAFGKLTMGDVSGAADALVGQVSGVGYGPIDDLQEIGFLSTDKTAAYYEYSAGAFTFGLGAGQVYVQDEDEFLDDGSLNPTFGLDIGRDSVNIGVKYAAGGYSVALAYEELSANVNTGDVDESMVSLGASAAFGPATVKARISDNDTAGDDTTWALSVDYVTGPATITAFYTDFGNTGADPVGDTQHIGLGAAYDLGGGATLAGGIVMQNNDTIDDETFADVGVKFSF
jgi:outer membrane protein OmpU